MLETAVPAFHSVVGPRTVIAAVVPQVQLGGIQSGRSKVMPELFYKSVNSWVVHKGSWKQPLVSRQNQMDRKQGKSNLTTHTLADCRIAMGIKRRRMLVNCSQSWKWKYGGEKHGTKEACRPESIHISRVRYWDFSLRALLGLSALLGRFRCVYGRVRLRD